MAAATTPPSTRAAGPDGPAAEPRLPTTLHVARLVAERIAAGAALLLILAALIKVIEVAARGIFGITWPGLAEILTLATGVAVALCLPAGFARGAQIRIDGIMGAFPKKIGQALEGMGDWLMLAFIAILAVMVWGVAQGYDAQGQSTVILKWPLAPFFYVIAFGFALSVPMQAFAMVTRKAVLSDGGWAFVRAGAGAVLILVVAAILWATGFVQKLDALPPITMAVILIAAMWGGMLLGVPLAGAMGLAGLGGLTLMLNGSAAASVAGSEAATFLSSPSLAVLPLFLMMGALASLAGLSSDIYRFANALLRPARAGLCHATIAASAGFGALTGSSLATAATFGRVAFPEMKARGYDPALAAGSIAAGGTLGSLVPPSTALILYALLTEQSIGALFVAALVPALLAVVIYMLVIAILVRIRPGFAPAGSAIDWPELRDAGRGCLGAAILFGTVIGGIYTGLFTDTEAASIGTAGAFAFAAFRGKLRGAELWRALSETTVTISLIYMLIFGAITFSFLLGFTGIPAAFAAFITGFDPAPMTIVLALVAAYIVLGMVMDSYAMMVITAPIFAPLILSIGLDPIWWGIVTVICVELGMISPPFGLNLFVMRSVAPGVSLSEIWKGVTPFVAGDIVKLAIVLAFPAILLS